MVPRAHLVPAVRPEDMSQDPAVVQAYLDDPLIPKGNVKAQTGNECLKVRCGGVLAGGRPAWRAGGRAARRAGCGGQAWRGADGVGHVGGGMCVGRGSCGDHEDQHRWEQCSSLRQW